MRQLSAERHGVKGRAPYQEVKIEARDQATLTQGVMAKCKWNVLLWPVLRKPSEVCSLWSTDR